MIAKKRWTPFFYIVVSHSINEEKKMLQLSTSVLYTMQTHSKAAQMSAVNSMRWRENE